MKNMLKDAMILFAITVISGLLLGLVYQVTKEPIAVQQEKAKQQACRAVFADAAEFTPAAGFDAAAATKAINEQFPEEGIEEALYAYDAAGEEIGVALTVVTHEGYGGDIRFTMGIREDGTLNGISILNISETAGLGMRADEVLTPQFADKNVEAFEYTKSGATSESQIDAISGATITTNAVTNGVNAGLTYYRDVLKGGEGQ